MIVVIRPKKTHNTYIIPNDKRLESNRNYLFEFVNRLGKMKRKNIEISFNFFNLSFDFFRAYFRFILIMKNVVANVKHDYLAANWT